MAVYALVREHSPSRLMAAYVSGGLAFTLGVGAAVLLVFSGIELHARTDRTTAIAEIAAGALAMALGAALLVRRPPLEKAAAAQSGQGRAAEPGLRALATTWCW